MRRRRRSKADSPHYLAGRRFMVYRLLDATGTPLYVGRSCDVRKRIKAHHAEASAPDVAHDRYRKRDWFFDVRDVSMRGPFTWEEAVRVEREEIERHQPLGNRDGVPA